MQYIFIALSLIGSLFGGYALHEKSAQQNVIEQNKVAIEMMQKQIDAMPQASLGAANSTFVGGQTYTLSGGGISSTGSSIDLTSFTIPQSGYKLTISNFGDTGGIVYGTIEPGNRTKQEFVACTGVTQNSDGTARLTGCSRGLAPIAPYTASTTLAFSHSGSSPFIIAISPAQYDTFLNKYNDATSSALLTFSSTSLPKVEYTTTYAQLQAATNTFATYGQLVSAVAAGAVDISEIVKGIGEAGTAVEQASSTLVGGTAARTLVQTRYSSSSPVRGCDSTSTVGALCIPVAQNDGKINTNYIGTSSSYTYNWGGLHTFNSTTTLTGTTTGGVSYLGQFMQLVSSTTINTTSGPVPVFIATSTNALVISEADVATTTDFLGFATSTNVTNGATGTVQISGIVNGFSGLTKGLPYYVQDTRGTIGTSVGSAELYVGTAVSATQILLDRKDGNMQYLGSASCSVSSGASSGQCDIPPVSPFTRFVDVDMNGSSSGGCGTATFEGQLRIYKVGRTSASLNYASYCNSGSVGQGIGTAAFTSTSSVRISLSHGPFANVSGTQTAYFYR